MSQLKQMAAIVTVALALGACAGPSGVTMEAGSVQSVLPPACFVRTSFSGPVQAYQPSLDAGDLAILFKRIDGEKQISFVCACRDSFNLTGIDKKEAENSFKRISGVKDWISGNSTLEDRGNAKLLKFEGEFENFQGFFSGKGAILYQGKCMQGGFAWDLLGREAGLDAYLNTLYDSKTSRPLLAGASSSPAPQADTPASRLATIKDLLDRKVITRQEYDERRRAILKGS